MNTSPRYLSDREVRQLEFLHNNEKFQTIIENWANDTLKNAAGVLVDIKKETLIRAISKRYKTSEDITRFVFGEILDAYYARIDGKTV